MKPGQHDYCYHQIHIDATRNATDDFNPFHDQNKWNSFRRCSRLRCYPVPCWQRAWEEGISPAITSLFWSVGWKSNSFSCRSGYGTVEGNAAGFQSIALLYRYRFSQISCLINLTATQSCDVIGQQLFSDYHLQ